jgi:putative aminopeptidase FrvX
MNESTFVQVLRELCDIPAPSGCEAAVKDYLRQRWQPLCETFQVDAVGNVLAKVGGRGPKVLIQAHMDEIGFVVRSISDDGFLWLDTAQGPRRQSPDRRYMIGQTAQVLGRHGVAARGIFAAASGHTMTQAQVDKAHLGFEDVFVDIGVTSRREAEMFGVHVGSPVIWYRPLQRVGRYLSGKAMDDRMPLAIMDQLLHDSNRAALGCELWFGATVQEENGLHGARAMGVRGQFDMVLALDVGLTGDIPTVGLREYDARLGGGPTLVHKDAAIQYDRRLLWHCADLAAQEGIAYQHGVYANYGSDGVGFIDTNIPALLIGIPTRYTHTAFEMIDPSDVHATVRLLQAFIQHPCLLT